MVWCFYLPFSSLIDFICNKAINNGYLYQAKRFIALNGSLEEAPGSLGHLCMYNPHRPAWQVDLNNLRQFKPSVSQFVHILSLSYFMVYKVEDPNAHQDKEAGVLRNLIKQLFGRSSTETIW